jgi:threonine/homoserine/homoserine lactone efflux protein
MLSIQELGWFGLAVLVLVLTPGPNMMYCVSRTLSQGTRAGMLSLAGVLVAFAAHLGATVLGLNALLLAVPLAFDVLKLLGAAYLLWLAWQAVKPGGQAPFEPRSLPADAPWVLFRMGFLTNLLNPKVAMFYVSLFPQFLHPERGDLLGQTLQLGVVQVLVSGCVNALIVLGAGRITRWLSRSEAWLRAQRWVTGGVLALLALRVAQQERA